MLFKLDENMPLEAVDVLTRAGHDATHILQQKLGGEADHRLAAICAAEGRCLISLDLGFANITAYPPAATSGLVILRPERQDRGTILEMVVRITRALESRRVAGRLWIVTRRRIRCRSCVERGVKGSAVSFFRDAEGFLVFTAERPRTRRIFFGSPPRRRGRRGVLFFCTAETRRARRKPTREKIGDLGVSAVR